MYWVNAEFADGTESDYENSNHYRKEANARKHAVDSTLAGVPACYVIKNGTVVAKYVGGEEVPA